MLNIRHLTVEVELGSFDEVQGVSLSGNHLMIVAEKSIAVMLPLAPTERFEVEGLFGEDARAEGYQFPLGIRIQEVDRIEVEDLQDPPTWDFHRRKLRIFTARGVVFVFMLYCVGGRVSLRETQVA